jgi:hypothetical protein
MAHPDPAAAHEDKEKQMEQVMVRYQVRPDRAAENEELVRAVFAELAETRPAGVGYATFVLEDGVTFVHVAQFDAENGGGRLQDVQAFARFTAGLEDRTVAPPVRTVLRRIGSYQVFGD